MRPDFELLTRYAADRDEAAFADLVQRHLDHVYSTALRLVGGDVHLAEDVAQAVFTDLARKAGSLRSHATLSGWLHTSARFAAANVVRTEQRRRQREQTAFAMPTNTSSEPDWDQVRGILDDSIGELSDPERDALMLRYFEKKPLAEVGAALGVSEDAARMRVDRATGKLRDRLTARGVTSTAAALSTVLAQNLVGNAPGSLGSQITAQALASAGVIGGGAHFLRSLTAKLAVVGVAVVFLGVIGLIKIKEPRPAPAPAVQSPIIKPAAADTAPPSQPAADSPKPAPAAAQEQPGLKLLFLDAQTGFPVTNKMVDLRGWERGSQLMVTKAAQVSEGWASVPFDLQIGRRFQVLTHLEGYADSHLHWNTTGGDKIPETYTLRLLRPALIYGRVVDSAGNPVTGATVGFNTENVAAMESAVEDHTVDYLTVKTDSTGYWQLNRLAPEMVHHIFGGASHPDYARSETVYASRQPELVQQFSDGTAVFRLADGVVVKGVVFDPDGAPVESATVRVGTMGSSQFRETHTEIDGSFIVRGCEPKAGLVTADAQGYAPVARALMLTTNMAPVELTLAKGQTLRMRVVDENSDPVPGASVILDSFPRGERSVPMPQIEFRRKADAEGRMVWETAPDQDLVFNVSGPGHVYSHDVRIRPDGEEYVVTLTSALVISGTVRDAATHGPISQFRIGIGWPEQGPDGIQPRWSDIDRFWLKFSDGQFHHSIEEMVVGGSTNRGYVFRFEAPGHKPMVTRAYRANEGDVRIDVELPPSKDIPLMVYTTDGKPAPKAQIGLVSPGNEVRLVPGGFEGALGHDLAWLGQTDGDGWFKLPDDENIQRVIVASPGGYAESTIEPLREARSVRLQPWARLEGEVRRQGEPVTHAEVKLLWNPGAPGLSFESPAAQTDSDGRFAFRQVPPGVFGISAAAGQDVIATAKIEVGPGETKQVVLARPSQAAQD